MPAYLIVDSPFICNRCTSEISTRQEPERQEQRRQRSRRQEPWLALPKKSATTETSQELETNVTTQGSSAQGSNITTMLSQSQISDTNKISKSLKDNQSTAQIPRNIKIALENLKTNAYDHNTISTLKQKLATEFNKIDDVKQPDIESELKDYIETDDTIKDLSPEFKKELNTLLEDILDLSIYNLKHPQGAASQKGGNNKKKKKINGGTPHKYEEVMDAFERIINKRSELIKSYNQQLLTYYPINVSASSNKETRQSVFNILKYLSEESNNIIETNKSQLSNKQITFLRFLNENSELKANLEKLKPSGFVANMKSKLSSDQDTVDSITRQINEKITEINNDTS